MAQVLGPILADKAKPLPADVDSFLTQGGLEGGGAVYVSMGTLARLDATELHSMAQALSGLPNPVLWKLDAAHLPGESMIDCQFRDSNANYNSPFAKECTVL